MRGGLWSHQRTVIAAALLSILLPFSPGSAQLLPQSFPSVNSNELPIEITAEQIEYLKEEDRYIADGSVNITQGAVHLTADHVVLENQTGLVVATGHAVLREGDDVLSSDRLEYNLRNQNGTATAGRLFVKKENLHLQAAQLDKTGEDHYELKTWAITSCDNDGCDSPAWQFRGRTARVDLGEYLVARKAVF